MRKSLLPNAKEWQKKLEKRAELRSKLQQAESEFLSFFESNLTKINGKEATLKNTEGDSLAVIKSVNPDNEITLFPEGRLFFEGKFSDNNLMKPSSWFDADSVYASLSLDEFLKLVNKGLLLRKHNNDDKESRQLRTFCMQILKAEQNPLTINLLLKFLSPHKFPFDEVTLTTWNCSSFPKLLEILEKSIPQYNAKECRQIFRECCLSALDHDTCTCTRVYPSILAACLQISSSEFPVSEELDWIFNLQLLPEERFHFLKILPLGESSWDFGLLFAARALQAYVKPTDNLQKLDFSDISVLLKTRELNIRSFSMNEVFHFLNILDYIILRLPIDSESYADIEEIISTVEHFKQHYHQEKGVAYYVINECINRICLTMQQRIPLNRDASIEIQCRKKLFIHS